MAFNVRSGGKAEVVGVADTVKSGDVVRIGQLVGIAEYDAKQSPAAEGGNDAYFTTLALEGIAHAPIATAVTPGQALYTATSSGTATLTTATTAGNKLVGIATRAKGSGAGEVWFKLVPNATVTV